MLEQGWDVKHRDKGKEHVKRIQKGRVKGQGTLKAKGKTNQERITTNKKGSGD